MKTNKETSKEIYEVEYKGKKFAMYQSYVGEPLCVAQYEDHAVMVLFVYAGGNVDEVF